MDPQPSVILDCSITMAWCFEDESTDFSEYTLEHIAKSAAVVPALWPVEVANVLVIAERKKRISHAKMIAFIELLSLLPIIVDNNLINRPILAIQELAREFKLSAYDAAYLDLAIRMDLPLATFDLALIKAAKKIDIKIFSFSVLAHHNIN